MKVIAILAVLAVAASAFEGSFLPNIHNVHADPLNPVPSLNLSAYQGAWYEIASITYIYEAGCYCSIANYTLNYDYTLKVKNICNWGSPTGKAITVPGTLAPTDPVNGTITTGKLSVDFLGYDLAPYYIIDVDPNYQWAVVGTPNRGFYFIISRTPTMDTDLYNQLLQNASAQEFNVSKIKPVYQGAGCPNTTLVY